MSGGIPKRVYHAFPTGGQTGGRITDLWVRKQRKRHQLKSYNEWLHPLASDGDGGLRPRIIMKKSERQEMVSKWRAVQANNGLFGSSHSLEDKQDFQTVLHNDQSQQQQQYVLVDADDLRELRTLEHHLRDEHRNMMVYTHH